MAELALDDAERVLDLRPDHREDAVYSRVEGMQRAVLDVGEDRLERDHIR